MNKYSLKRFQTQTENHDCKNINNIIWEISTKLTDHQTNPGDKNQSKEELPFQVVERLQRLFSTVPVLVE